MQATEMLITCFNGPELVGTVYLESTTAKVNMTCADEDGEDVVVESWKVASDAFDAVWKILDQLVKVPVEASS